jgi:hypothetical protein
MKWDSIEALGTIAAAVVAAIAIWSQNKAFKATLSADLAMKLDDRFSLPEFREIRAKAARALRDHVAEEDAEDIFDFFETVGLFTRRKVLDAEIVHSFFFHWINVYWTAGRDHISKKQRETSSAWKDFGDLYLKVLKIEMKEDRESGDISPSPEKIASYLNDEIALAEGSSQYR